jgi:stage II sporulation protein D
LLPIYVEMVSLYERGTLCVRAIEKHGEEGMYLKRTLAGLLLFVLVVFTLPLLILKGCGKEAPKGEDFADVDSMKLAVFHVEKNELEEMNLEEYVMGVLAGEMPSDFNIEALKAQALAARTYTLLRARAFGGSGCSQHPGADICTDPAHCQAYKSPTAIKTNYDKYKEAVLATKGQIIVYNDALIDAVFHSSSGGRTENSEDVWSAKVPYLRSVVSEYEDQTKIVSSKEIKVTDFIATMQKLDSSVKLSAKNIKNQVDIIERSEGGKITRVNVGGKPFTGSKLRSALGLKSTNFDITYKADTMVFHVTGNGHGIGMSQYGADGMGKLGYKYTDIVKHYYVGVEIMSIKELANIRKQGSYKASTQ